jgi:16S rRNA (guanine1516-N2)-methyltransferase
LGLVLSPGVGYSGAQTHIAARRLNSGAVAGVGKRLQTGKCGHWSFYGDESEWHLKKVSAELCVDFVNGPVAHRRRFGGGRGQDLAKAMGLRGGKTPMIIDATAGLGRDSFLLASLGAQVIMIERSEKMHALLAEGMKRAEIEGGELREIIGRMTLLKGDAKDLLPELSGEAILIDPMHPPRKSSALVRQELRQVREIVGSDDDAGDLVRVALKHALNRVVLKWPAKADPLEGIIACSHQICGKTTRYDVFMTGQGSPHILPA